MKCPRCGEELKRSKKDPTYGLCYTCRKKFKWVDDVDEDGFEIEDDLNSGTYNYGKTSVNNRPKAKKKSGCLKPFLIVCACLVIIVSISSLFSGSDTQNEDKKTDKKQEQEAGSAPDSDSAAVENDEPDVPMEYKSALAKAEQYSDVMHMSKQGIYDQLVSEYGEQFSAEAAQYAIDNLQADYNANALEMAKTYQETMNMSPEAIRDQLVSEYGEKFTQEEADYAIANLPQ